MTPGLKWMRALQIRLFGNNWSICGGVGVLSKAWWARGCSIDLSTLNTGLFALDSVDDAMGKAADPTFGGFKKAAIIR